MSNVAMLKWRGGRVLFLIEGIMVGVAILRYIKFYGIIYRLDKLKTCVLIKNLNKNFNKKIILFCGN